MYFMLLINTLILIVNIMLKSGSYKLLKQIIVSNTCSVIKHKKKKTLIKQ